MNLRNPSLLLLFCAILSNCAVSSIAKMMGMMGGGGGSSIAKMMGMMGGGGSAGVMQLLAAGLVAKLLQDMRHSSKMGGMGGGGHMTKIIPIPVVLSHGGGMMGMGNGWMMGNNMGVNMMGNHMGMNMMNNMGNMD